MTDLTPATRDQFASVLTPCLALVGGVGMDDRARREWLHAAWAVLRVLPFDLLKRGARGAMARVDHPSKIVAAIMAEVKDDLDWRHRAVRARMDDERADQEMRAMIAHQRWKPDEGETARILTEYGIASVSGSSGLNRGKAPPTVDDYVGLGVDRAEAEMIVARQARECARGTVGDVLAKHEAA